MSLCCFRQTAEVRECKLYIGEKGKDVQRECIERFPGSQRFGLRQLLLSERHPAKVGAAATVGTFDTTASGALTASKFEDVDTSPSDPTRAVLGDQDSGVFTFDFDLDFDGGSFRAGPSGFTVTRDPRSPHGVHEIGDADNVEWTAPTVLSGKTYAEGLIFVNEDHTDGEIWMNAPDGSDLTLIGDTAGIPAARRKAQAFSIFLISSATTPAAFY